MSDAQNSNHVINFSTDLLPERDRFDMFLAAAAKKWLRTDVKRHCKTPFFSHNRVVELGSTTCMEFNGSPGSYGRSRALLADGHDNFILVTSTAVPVHDSVRDAVVESGDAMLFNSAEMGYARPLRPGTMLMVSVPHRILTRLIPGAEDFARTSFVKNRMELNLLRAYVASVFAAPNLCPATLQTAGTHIADLVALAIGASGDAAHRADNQCLRAARSLALRQTIATKLSDPALSLTTVARENGISERQTQRLFNDLGTSFSQFLQAKRLDLAHALLLHPLQRDRRIADIALDSGFADLSHFNRSFRLRFGDTPSGIRARLRHT